MPARNRPRRPAMYNTPHIRNGGFGVLQVEAVTNRPASIQRRHLAASQLRMRDIEPDELSSSEWVRFLVMESRERERFISTFMRLRRESSASSSSSTPSTDMDREVAYDKAEEARLEAEDAGREEQRAMDPTRSPSPPTACNTSGSRGTTPFVSIWARHIEGIERAESEGTVYTPRRPMHTRRAAGDEEAPPAYNSIIPPGEAPPAYSPTSDDEGTSPGPSRRSRISRFSSQYLNRF
ncbi:hypothetical protein CERZMDRAFT_92780 [Cercospora zeae-maydis SCOH1-5]|uniref:Uncharacterized protein n=1 Tax=Cercospora zeae-maydis SCOH1-5 TaxID=717836 RepID=A0A6A6FU26_9PEZI|nr:hypothetical protein CERZMDRAFT_92780 [Cercospora zeae-maydis SCOH1-5]